MPSVTMSPLSPPRSGSFSVMRRTLNDISNNNNNNNNGPMNDFVGRTDGGAFHAVDVRSDSELDFTAGMANDDPSAYPEDDYDNIGGNNRSVSMMNIRSNPAAHLNVDDDTADNMSPSPGEYGSADGHFATGSPSHGTMLSPDRGGSAQGFNSNPDLYQGEFDVEYSQNHNNNYGNYHMDGASDDISSSGRSPLMLPSSLYSQQQPQQQQQQQRRDSYQGYSDPHGHDDGDNNGDDYDDGSHGNNSTNGTSGNGYGNSTMKRLQALNSANTKSNNANGDAYDLSGPTPLARHEKAFFPQQNKLSNANGGSSIPKTNASATGGDAPGLPT